MATILVTAGPTREHLDDVRFLSNGSTGRMGYALAAAAVAAGHRVCLISGITALTPPPGAQLTKVVSALQMLEAVQQNFSSCDLMFAVAAVADHRPASRKSGKPEKAEERIVLELVRNQDIVATVAANKGKRVVVGFALESFPADQPKAALTRAARKLENKHLDLIVLNPTEALGAGGTPAWIVYGDGRTLELPALDKNALAVRLLAEGLSLWLHRSAEGQGS